MWTALQPHVGAITHLDLSGYGWFFMRFTKNNFLNTRSNQLAEVPAWLAALTALQHVAIRHCTLQSIPSFVHRLRHLQELHLCGNEIQSILDVSLPHSLQYVHRLMNDVMDDILYEFNTSFA